MIAVILGIPRWARPLVVRPLVVRPRVRARLCAARIATVVVAVVALCGFAAAATEATAAPVDPALRQWLHAPCSAPSPAQLASLGPNLVRALRAVAADPSERRYGRHRAIAFLSRLAESAALSALISLRSDGDPMIRGSVAMAIASGAGRRPTAGALDAMAPLLADPNASVRLAAARALRLVADGPARRAVARQRRMVETSAAVIAQLNIVLRSEASAPATRRHD